MMKKDSDSPTKNYSRSETILRTKETDSCSSKAVHAFARFLLVTFIFWTCSNTAVFAGRPNIVYILCDDLGYGDVHCLAPETSKIATPHADRLAAEGIVFTDAHSGSSVCTPTRYGIMTGRYSWRTRLQKGVVTGFAPSLIDERRMTVADFLQQHGYATAAIGKWHLDCQYLHPTSGKAYSPKQHKLPPLDATIPDGPSHRGFDYFHGFHHARSMKAIIENGRVTEYDEEINMLPRLTRKTVEYIDLRAGKDEPFFLYLPLGSPHTPILPTEAWRGKSGLGKYGDFVMQTDHVVGEVSKTLAKHGMTDNTIVILTSDNGASRAAGLKDLAAKGHLASAHLRGSKSDIWDGGHRVPFIVRWPGHVEPASTSQQMICLTDLFATMADILNADVPPGTCEDSVSFLPALSGEPIVSTRAGIIHHSISGHFAYRVGRWKLILARGSGGWSSPTEAEVARNAPAGQLYDLMADPSEHDNLYASEPEQVEQMIALLTADVRRGRSTEGHDSNNDMSPIVLWKNNRQNSKTSR